MKKLLIVGSNSTAGSYFVHHCSISSDLDLTLASRRNELLPQFLPYKFKSNNSLNKFDFINLDLNDSAENLFQAIDSIKPDYIVNFSSLCMVGQSWLKPGDWYQTNLIGQSNLMEAISKYAKLTKYIHFTTPEVYGSCTNKVDEDCPFNPTTPYAVSRAAGDMATRVWSMKHSINTLFVRASSIYCEGQHFYRIIPRSLLCALKNIPMNLEGSGNSLRYFLHMQDVSEALLMLLNYSSDICDTFHLSASSPITIKGVMNKCFHVAGKLESECNLNYVAERPGLDHCYSLNDSKMRSLGWAPQINLDDGIKRVCDWISTFSTIDHNLLNYQHVK